MVKIWHFFIIFDHFPRPGEIDICKIFMIRVAQSLIVLTYGMDHTIY